MDQINWQELTATMAILGVFVWGITKGLPNLIAKFAEESEQQRKAFTSALHDQRAEFRDDLRDTREQSRELATSGHAAVEHVTGAVKQVTQAVEQLSQKVDQIVRIDTK